MFNAHLQSPMAIRRIMHSQKWIKHYIYQPIYLPFMYMLVSYRNKHVIPTLMMLSDEFLGGGEGEGERLREGDREKERESRT